MEGMANGAGSPCIRCGACCCFYRVEFYWREAEEGFSKALPRELFEEVDEFKRAMKGTLKQQGQGRRCSALEGKVGKKTRCSQYASRPSPCRAFEPSTDQKPNPRCDEARKAFGLKPLFALKES